MRVCVYLFMFLICSQSYAGSYYPYTGSIFYKIWTPDPSGNPDKYYRCIGVLNIGNDSASGDGYLASDTGYINWRGQDSWWCIGTYGSKPEIPAQTPTVMSNCSAVTNTKGGRGMSDSTNIGGQLCNSRINAATNDNAAEVLEAVKSIFNSDLVTGSDMY